MARRPAATPRPSAGEWLEYGMARLMPLLPVTWVSALGGYLGRRHVRRARRLQRRWVTRLLANLDYLQGEADAAERERRLLAYGDQVGRVYSELTVLPRLLDSRLRVAGAQHLRECRGPLILVAPHLANWELMAGVLRLLEAPLVDLFEPRESALRMRIARRVRETVAAGRVVWVATESPLAMRRVKQALARGHHALLFCDEMHHGVSRGPALGRTLDYAGHRWMAARLAVAHGATVVPVVIRREPGVRFVLEIAEPLEVDASLEGEARARQLADAIDARLEHWVRACPTHWYWLKDATLAPEQRETRDGGEG
ncbi:MAG: lysophospholipid acyltransferase family protein [Pseudomonadota bacterium]